MSDVDDIKLEAFNSIRRRRVILIVQSDYGYRVDEWTSDSVFPSTDYDTPHEAGARALQLLGLSEPVTPQDWPEEIGLGEINNKPIA